MRPLVLVLVGPTATGKSKLILKLAKKFLMEIVSADSMQIYKGLDIGTAKPTKEERRRVKHHLIDIIPTSRNFSVYLFRKKALEAIRKIVDRGRTPVLVGGSGLYVRALLNGLTQYPRALHGLRARLEKDLKRHGVKELFKRLKKLDPARSRELDSTNPRRVIRALEIALSKKKKTGAITELPSLSTLGYEVKVFGLAIERQQLYKQVEKRIDLMFRKGWIEEARRLFKKRLSRTVRQAIGYRQIWNSPLMHSKKISLREKREAFALLSDAVKLTTRHLVKKQCTWYRREPWIEWLDVTTSEGCKNAQSRLIRELESAYAN